MSLMLFVNLKGGVAKTTNAVAVAECLADLGKRVLRSTPITSAWLLNFFWVNGACSTATFTVSLCTTCWPR